MEIPKADNITSDTTNIRKAVGALMHPTAPFVETEYSGKLWKRFRDRFIKEIMADAEEHFRIIRKDTYENFIASLIGVQLMHDNEQVRNMIISKLAKYELTGTDEFSWIEWRYKDLFEESKQYAAPFPEYIVHPTADPEWMMTQIVEQRPLEFGSEKPELKVSTTFKEMVGNSTDCVLGEWLNMQRVMGKELNEQNFVRMGFPDSADRRLYLAYRIRDRVHLELLMCRERLQLCESYSNELGTEEISRLKRQMQNITNDTDREIEELEAEIRKLRDELQSRSDDAKNREIAQLKSRIRKLDKSLSHHEAAATRQMEAKEEVQTGEDVAPVQQEEKEPDDTDYIDYDYRYLFPIVEHMNVEPDIVSLFPNAKITHTVNGEIPAGTQLIVMITDIQSHSLYYKYKNRNYDIVHVPKANMEIIKQKLNEYFRKRKAKNV